MSLIAARSRLVRCANPYCRSVVLSGDSRCARCGSGQGTRGPHRAKASLGRCANPECRAFILDSDTRCGHCGCEARAFRAFRFGVAVLGRGLKVGLTLAVVVLLALWVVKVEQRRPGTEPPSDTLDSAKPGLGDRDGGSRP